LISEGHYYDFSSVFFYTDRTSLLITDRRVNLDYGSHAPDAPHMFIGDTEFKTLWAGPGRCYLLVRDSDLPKFEGLAGSSAMSVVASSGGKLLLTNHSLRTVNFRPLPGRVIARRDAILHLHWDPRQPGLMRWGGDS
jgi:hypothetical protein